MKFDKLQRIALYIFLFSINFEVWDPFNTGGFFSISKLTGIIYFLTISRNIKSFFRTDQILIFLRPLALFFIYLLVISFININSVNSSFINFTMMQVIVLFWIITNHERKDSNIIEKGLLYFVLGSFVLSILAYLGIGIENSVDRVSIFGDNQNNIGLRMSVSSIIILITVYQNKLNYSKWRYLLLGILPFLLILMIGTGSRVSVISFALAMFLLLLLLKEKFIKKIFIWIASIVLGIYGWKIFLAKENLMDRLQSTVGEGDLGGRQAIWQKVIPLIENNPIFGVGKTGYAQYAMGVFNEVKSPHNVILELLLYTGFIGLCIFFYFLYRLVKSSYSYFKTTGNLLSFALFIPVLGMILSGHILESKMVYIIFAYAASRAFYFNKLKNENLLK